MTVVIRIHATDAHDRRCPKGLIATAQLRFCGGLLDGLHVADVKVWQTGEGLDVRAPGLPGFDGSHPLAQAIIRAFESCESRIELDLLTPAHVDA